MSSEVLVQPIGSVAQMQARTDASHAGNSWWQSSFIVALLVLCLMNAGAWIYELGYYNLDINPHFAGQPKFRRFLDFAYRKNVLFPHYLAIDDALEEFARCSKPPQVVLLGSSLTNDPLINLDYGEHPDLFKYFAPACYHHSIALDQALAKVGFKSSIFNLSSDGAFASDREMIAEFALRGTNRPQWLVVAVSPDDLLGPKVITDNYFERFAVVSVKDFFYFAHLYHLSSQDILQFFSERLCYLHFYRLYWQTRLLNATGILAGNLFGPGPALDMKAFTQFIAASYALGYKTRLDKDGIDLQMHSIERILIACKQSNTKVLLVNMPQGKEHVALMPDGLANRFDSQLHALANQNHLCLLDLTHDRKFQESDFADNVHLNRGGARKFIERLVQSGISPQGEAHK